MNNKNFTDNSKSGIESSLISEFTGDQIKDLTIEGAELALDLFLEDGVLKQIPVFEVLYKACKAALGLRESIFAKKVFKFLLEVKDIPQAERQKFISELEKSDEYRNRVGEKLVVLLDQLDDMGKPELIGRLLKASVEGKISFEEFLRISAMVQKAFLPDLKRLKTGHVPRFVEEQFVTLGIFSLTLEEDKSARRHSTENKKTLPLVKFKLTDMGKKLITHCLK